MQAIIIKNPGGPEVLQLKERESPKPQPSEVLIEVKAAGINRPDVFQRMGGYPAPAGAPDDIPGLEVAGIIKEVGKDVMQWNVGEKVCALVAGGGYASQVTAPAVQCLPIPQGLSFVEGASLPETFFTVWSNVFDRGNFQKGESFLVHGGTSGIGVTAIQMVKSMGGKVFTTAGTQEKCDVAINLGADLAINYKVQDFEKYLKEKKEEVDVILDMVGGDYTAKNINILNPEGRLVIINAMKNAESTINMKKVMVKRLTITGSTLRARSPEFKGAIAEKLKKNIWPKIEIGEIKPVIYRTFPLAEASKAHELMESSEHIGKIVLEI
ncbi:NAD(P)H quinone oxidoreductase [Marivirga tractuosa]|uniref:NAD(P)H quinone oxidoreductase, PIG3 family n=1 Tax=Marivirga tractuosa (strain ATCC 23168 / DSM 4126 / NBRC 15989 / NCIMB 1408 / VKM B-1430 / H-43) TaxID=643867 RepID=E4TKY1_MARTH|nr:NAD(P)H-quinone oxidoreductase [Marivirga tractuosa]ADR22284.1 NAD(P)H quinone oxidoreductase, PIG3 family [Marivirga tractuosa DSM 4126]BDD13250.1 NAD(P)H quinone oxidoreductase [Marivirga tractuosa]